jgi:hypothetical protein
MRMRAYLAGAAVAATVVTCSCGGQGGNSTGQGAAAVLHATLRSDVSADQGVALNERIDAVTGVAYTQYTPAGGLTVGVKSQHDVASVEAAMRAQPEVAAVTQQ